MLQSDVCRDDFVFIRFLDDIATFEVRGVADLHALPLECPFFHTPGRPCATDLECSHIAIIILFDGLSFPLDAKTLSLNASDTFFLWAFITLE